MLAVLDSVAGRRLHSGGPLFFAVSHHVQRWILSAGADLHQEVNGTTETTPGRDCIVRTEAGIPYHPPDFHPLIFRLFSGILVRFRSRPFASPSMARASQFAE